MALSAFTIRPSAFPSPFCVQTSALCPAPGAAPSTCPFRGVSKVITLIIFGRLAAKAANPTEFNILKPRGENLENLEKLDRYRATDPQHLVVLRRTVSARNLSLVICHLSIRMDPSPPRTLPKQKLDERQIAHYPH